MQRKPQPTNNIPAFLPSYDVTDLTIWSEYRHRALTCPPFLIQS